MTREGPVYQASFDLFAEGAATYTDYLVEDLVPDEIPEEADSGVPRAEKLEGYAVYIFTKPTPYNKSPRCYYIYYQPSLWENFTVQRQWGLLGSDKQQFYTEHFRSSRPALARVRRLIQHRLRRGYKLHYAA
ncbi:MAG TPA: hypothetical protein VH186_25990 [Chloroflexia bacterium]|nr:hypothetical protein [Chloroflexia bacterium]